MKRDQVPDAIAKMIDEKLQSFMWDFDEDGNINALMLRFDGGSLMIQTRETFNIEVSRD